MSSSFNLGAGAVFEHEGSIQAYVSPEGYSFYGDVNPGGVPETVDEPLDMGTFNARVPLEFKGGLRFGVPLNVYAGLTVINDLPPGNTRFFQLHGRAPSGQVRLEPPPVAAVGHRPARSGGGRGWR